MAYSSSQLDNLLALRLLKILVTPFNEFPAYKSGIIDENGKYIIPQHKRTSEQRRTLTYLDRLLINVKKLINKLPGGESKLKNLIAAMFLIKECQQNQDDGELLTEQYVVSFVDQCDINDQNIKRLITMWETYIKLREQCTSAAISGGENNTEVNDHVANNNTGGVQIYSTPLIHNVSHINRRKTTE